MTIKREKKKQLSSEKNLIGTRSVLAIERLVSRTVRNITCKGKSPHGKPLSAMGKERGDSQSHNCWRNELLT